MFRLNRKMSGLALVQADPLVEMGSVKTNTAETYHQPISIHLEDHLLRHEMIIAEDLIVVSPMRVMILEVEEETLIILGIDNAVVQDLRIAAVTMGAIAIEVPVQEEHLNMLHLNTQNNVYPRWHYHMILPRFLILDSL